MNYEMMVGLNFIAIVELIFLIFFIKSNVAFSKRRNKCFFIAAVVNIILILTDIAQYCISHNAFPNQHLFETIATTICYMLNPSLPLVLVLLVGDRKKYIFPVVVVGINAIFSITFSSLYLSTLNKTYMLLASRSVGILSLLLFGYAAFLLLKKQLQSRNERIFMLIVVMVICFSYFVEVLLEYRFVLWSSCAMCLVLFYMQFHTKILKEDILTGFYNRFVFEKDIHEKIMIDGIPIVEFDVNGLKRTNDVSGHAAGDKLIVDVTSAIKKVFKNGRCYRIGGDEFVFIGNEMTEEELNYIFKEFSETIENENMVSYGYCFTTDTLDALSALKKADKMMYERKNDLKKRLLVGEK